MGVDWEAKHREAASDPRTARQLIEIALIEEDEHAAWAAIYVLHHRGDHETFEAARELCASADLKERTWGVRILAQLGIPKRSFPDQSLDILLPLLALETRAALLSDIAFALGHIGDVRAVEPLSRLRNHPSPEVRYGVVHGLLCQEHERAIQALIELSVDEDTKVRDWATFGLGTQIDADTPAIRDALLARLADEDAETRGEVRPDMTSDTLVGHIVGRRARLHADRAERNGACSRHTCPQHIGQRSDPETYRMSCPGARGGVGRPGEEKGRAGDRAAIA